MRLPGLELVWGMCWSNLGTVLIFMCVRICLILWVGAYMCENICVCVCVLGQTNKGGREWVWAGSVTNIFPQNDHHKITKVILHMCFGLAEPLQTSFEPKEKTT